MLPGRMARPRVFRRGREPEALVRLPQSRAELPGHASAPDAPSPAPVVEGPSLWSVLAEAGAVDPAQPCEQVRRVVLATGRDGCVAVLAPLSRGNAGKGGFRDGRPLFRLNSRPAPP